MKQVLLRGLLINVNEIEFLTSERDDAVKRQCLYFFYVDLYHQAQLNNGIFNVVNKLSQFSF